MLLKPADDVNEHEVVRIQGVPETGIKVDPVNIVLRYEGHSENIARSNSEVRDISEV